MADERTLGQLFADASRDISDLVRHEVALAKAEIKADVKNGALAGGLFGAAGYLVVLASVVLTIAAGYGLSETGLPAWAAFLIVGAALLLLAAILVLVGRSRVSRVGPPERTIRSTKATIAAVRNGTQQR